MNINRLFGQFVVFSSLSGIAMMSYANDAEISNNAVNYVLWFAVMMGVASGFLVYQWLHKNFKSHETLKSWATAVVVALSIASIPLWLGQYSSVCMQQITDSSGQVRDMVNAADQCVLSRESVSALGVSSVITGFKSALGYDAAGSFLSTGAVKFFYYLMVFFWTTILYLLALWGWKKLKH